MHASLLVIDPSDYPDGTAALDAAMRGNRARERDPLLPMCVLTEEGLLRASQPRPVCATRITLDDGRQFWRPQCFADEVQP